MSKRQTKAKAKPKPNLDAALSAVAQEHIVARAVRIQDSPDTVAAGTVESDGHTLVADASIDIDPPVRAPDPEPEAGTIIAAEPVADDAIEPTSGGGMSADEIAARYTGRGTDDGRIEPVLRRTADAPPPPPVSRARAPAEAPGIVPHVPAAAALEGDGGPRLVADNTGLVANGLGKRFKQRPVLRGVSVSVQRGEVVGLLGPNGAGKTTCFYIITGLIDPDYGSILMDGEDITDLPMYRRARMGIGYLPQEPSIFRGLSVENNIRAVLEVTEEDRDVREARLDELLAEFSITHIRRSPALALSGGERRRVEIARALATNPHFVLLDEPLAGIDPIALGDIRDLVIHLKDRGIGVLITDHNVRETLEVVDRAYIIHEGVVLMSGEPREIVAHEDVRRVYLGEKFSL